MSCDHKADRCAVCAPVLDGLSGLEQLRLLGIALSAMNGTNAKPEQPIVCLPLEAKARELCIADGHDPDGPTCDIYVKDDPVAHMPWAAYRRAALAALGEVRRMSVFKDLYERAFASNSYEPLFAKVGPPIVCLPLMRIPAPPAKPTKYLPDMWKPE